MIFLAGIAVGALLMHAAELWFGWRRKAGYHLALDHADNEVRMRRAGAGSADVEAVTASLRGEWK